MALIRFLLRHTVELAAVESLALGVAIGAITCLVVDRLFVRNGIHREVRRELALRGLRPFIVVATVAVGLLALRTRRLS